MLLVEGRKFQPSHLPVLALPQLLGLEMHLEHRSFPPYFIFKDQQFTDELLQGATIGSAATMSKSGWSNSFIFQEYLENHFIKFIQRSDPSQPIIVPFDGHKSHINIPVTEWAKINNIILFVLPAHTSNILQPLDVGCFGPLQKIYNSTMPVTNS